MNFSSTVWRPLHVLRKHYGGHPLRLATSTLKSFFLFHVIWEHFYAYSSTTGPSMLPTMEVFGDGVIVDRWYRRGRGVQIGDLVTFDSVVKPGEKVVKRVLGLEGDYVLRDTPESGSDAMIQASIPQGHCWLVGDNLPASRDSRMFGPVPMALIKGKIIYRIMSSSEWQKVENGLRAID